MMDPDVALENARRAAAILLGPGADSDEARDRIAGADLAEAFDALDGWLSRGGFPPTAWKAPAE